MIQKESRHSPLRHLPDMDALFQNQECINRNEIHTQLSENFYNK